MHQISSKDSAFLFLETSRTPMHIGGLYIFSPSSSGGFSFNQFKQHLENRIHLEPTLRKKLVKPPLNIGNPSWMEDPEFCINLHLNHIGLPQPATKPTLYKIASENFRRPLDRNRPLWEITFIDGIDNIDGFSKGSFAIIPKIHHAAVDSALGEKLLTILLDFTPKPRKLQTDTPWNPQPIPSELELFVKNFRTTLKSPLKLGRALLKTSKPTANLLAKRALGKLNAEPSVTRAPASLFDQAVSDDRTFSAIHLDLNTIKKVKNQIDGASLNNIILCACAGALREYLLEKNELPPEPLVAWVPVSTNNPKDGAELSHGTYHDYSSQISCVLTSLATQEAEPLKRLEYIIENSQSAPEYANAISAQQLVDYIPAIYLSVATKLYTRWQISERHNSLFNLVILNVPGPQIPLYLNGAKLMEFHGLSPIFDGIGPIISISSYNGNISVSVTSCEKIMPDTMHFLSMVETSLNKLAAVVKQKKRQTPETSHKTKQTSAKTAKRKTSHKKQTANQTSDQRETQK